MEEYTFSLPKVAEYIEPIADLLDMWPGVVYVMQDDIPVMEILSAGVLKAFHNAISELSETVATFSQEKQ